MFAAHLKRVYNVCNVILIRELRHSRSLGPRGQNPGLDKRLAAFQKEGIRFDDEDAEEYVEQSESDFSKAHISYDEHMKESILGKHDLKHHIVKNKYFKENMPNLLTWSEKEQIRHLCSEHPDEWTPERIAQSFPVTAAVVKKLLKYPWKPASEERIARHDASAMRNWKELKDGTLNLPKDLQEHFLKFSNRKIPPLNKNAVKIDLTQEKEMGEYEKIVQKCAAQNQNTQTEQSNVPECITNSAESRPKEVKKKYQKIMTLDELATKLKQRVERGSNITVPDQMIVDSVNEKPLEINNTNLVTELELQSSEETKVVQYKEPDNSKSIMEYPERIRIPKKAYKRGATYKVNDCYYDHDGKFLYRVLGMSN